MTDDLAEIIMQVWGEGDGFLAPGSHGPPADAARVELATSLRDLAACAKSMEAIVRSDPDDDETFDTLNEMFAEAWQKAGLALIRFRNIRECTGES